LSKCKKVASAIRVSAAMLVESWNLRKFWMLLKMLFPSSML
jgi:hypothetical protein